MRSILVVGCGYAGERLARLHLGRGDRVLACTRDDERAERLRQAGAEIVPLDLDAGEPSFPATDLAYWFAPPPAYGVVDTRLARALGALPPQQLVYASTTGVYGDRGGASVGEEAPPAPGTDRARRRVDAETRARRWGEQSNVPVAILRIAGIYGPGRLPMERLAGGQAVADVTSGPGNRIHVDDLVAAAVAVGDMKQGGTWNVCDGNPLPTAEFNDLVADLAGLPRPRRVPPDSPELSEGMRSFLVESRRVDNRKLLAVPGFRLRYADPAEGIRASLAE